MKRTLIAAVAVLTLAAIPLGAQPPHGGGGRGAGRGIGPGGPGGPGPAPMRLLRELNLTQEQREQIRALHEERREGQPGAKLMELQKQLHAAIFAETPDLATIEGLKSAIAAEEAARLAARIDAELRIAQILTPEQRAKARELAAKGPERGRRGRP